MQTIFRNVVREEIPGTTRVPRRWGKSLSGGAGVGAAGAKAVSLSASPFLPRLFTAALTVCEDGQGSQGFLRPAVKTSVGSCSRGRGNSRTSCFGTSSRLPPSGSTGGFNEGPTSFPQGWGPAPAEAGRQNSGLGMPAYSFSKANWVWTNDFLISKCWSQT